MCVRTSYVRLVTISPPSRIASMFTTFKHLLMLDAPDRYNDAYLTKQSNSRVSCIKYFGLRSNKTMRQNNRNLG